MQEKSKPSRAAAGIAAALPILFGLFAFVVLLVMAGGPSDLFHMIAEAGGAAYLVFLTAILGMFASAVILVILGLGIRVPTVLAVGAAALPWIVGCLGMMAGMVRVNGALSFVTADIRAELMARGLAEATNARVLGSVLGGAILAATAIGLGIVSIGQRAPGRSPLGALVGAGSAVVFLVAAAVAIALAEVGLQAAILLLPAIGAIVALGLAGAGAGADEPHGRSAALAAAAPIAAGLAFVAGAVATSTFATIEVFTAVAGVDPADRGRLVAMAAAEVAPIGALERWGGVVAVVPALALSAWAFSRARPSLGRIGGGCALVLAAVLVVGLDAMAIGSAGDSLARVAAPPWSTIEGFQPIALEGEDGDTTARFVIGADGVAHRLSDPAWAAALGTPAGVRELEAAFGATVRDTGSGESWPEDVPDSLREREPDEGGTGARHKGEEGTMRRADAQKSPSRYGIRGPDDIPDPHLARDAVQRLGVLGILSSSTGVFGAGSPVETPTIALAIDARLPAPVLRAVLETAQAAGARSVRVVGTPMPYPDDAPASAHEDVSNVPLLAALATTTRSRLVLLEGAVAGGWADRDPHLFHAIVTGAGPLILETRAGGEGPRRIDARQPGPPPSRLVEAGADRSVAYLSIGPGITAGVFFDALDRAAAAGLQPLAVIGTTTPGHPERPAEGLAALGSPEPGTVSDDGIAVEIEVRGRVRSESGSEVGGSGTLGAEEVRRVIARGMGAIQRCYESQLRRDPTLRGRVVINFTIGASGAVPTASVAEGTIDDAAVGTCVAAVIRRYRFPPPEGGSVTYSFPFVFEPIEPQGFGSGAGGSGAGIGFGGLGTIGSPSAGGHGLGANQHEGQREAVPIVQQGAAVVRGSLSSQVIQMVVRRHTNEVKFCYEQELARTPELEGRVIVNVVISPTGSVQTASVTSSTLGNVAVESCVTRAIQRWTFPEPEGGGIVVVTYPFVFARSR